LKINYTRYLIPLALIVFLIYRRIKRTIGFQKYIPAVIVTRIILFSIVSAIVLFFTVTQINSLIADIAGFSIGLLLLYLAIKNKVFEKREKGLYYRAHIWIELIIMILFLARFVYRFSEYLLHILRLTVRKKCRTAYKIYATR